MDKYLLCPKCKSSLVERQKYYLCQSCGNRYFKDGSIVRMLYVEKLKSNSKWEERYSEILDKKEYLQNYHDYKKKYFTDTYEQLNETKKINNIIYLEIGCGPFYLGSLIAKKCKLIIGIDNSYKSLMIAQAIMKKNKIKNYILIHGDIKNIPLKSNIVDLIYGGGVIEHFDDTGICLKELYRVLNSGGVSFNTVPLLNIGSLTYRQIWGNIPNFPVIKQIAIFIHQKLLNGKHMKFGYELSFLPSTIYNLHRNVGFNIVNIDKFKVFLAFDFIPSFLRKPFVFLSTNSILFWPMIKIIAKK